MTDEPSCQVEPRDALPETYRKSLRLAQKRTLRRKHGPVVTVDPDTTTLTSPFSEAVEEWRWMVIDTFGTRSHQVANVFLNHLSTLCSSTWNETARRWVPNEDELTAVLHIVAAHRPKNEAEAALAAQIAATHMITMKVARFAYDHPHDSKTVASYAKLARTAANQIDTMAGLKGKRRTSKQQITVSHKKHIHQHQHVHVGGAEKPEGQPHGTDERTAVTDECGSVSGSQKGGLVVPVKGHAR